MRPVSHLVKDLAPDEKIDPLAPLADAVPPMTMTERLITAYQGDARAVTLCSRVEAPPCLNGLVKTSLCCTVPLCGELC